MDLIIREFNKNEIRMINKNGEVYFVATDVCKVLGIKNNRDVVSRLDDDEVINTHVIDSMNRQQEVIAVNESGLHALIMRSNKPNAKAFRKWVTSEVLPSVLKTGSYIAPKAQDYISQKSVTEYRRLLWGKMNDEINNIFKSCLGDQPEDVRVAVLQSIGRRELAPATFCRVVGDQLRKAVTNGFSKQLLENVENSLIQNLLK